MSIQQLCSLKCAFVLKLYVDYIAVSKKCKARCSNKNIFPIHPYFNVYRLFDDMLTNYNKFLSRELDPMPI